MKKHIKTFFRGLCRTVAGTCISVGIYHAIYGFSAVPDEGGYAAVGGFVMSAALLVSSLTLVWFMGASRPRKERK